MKIFQNFFMLAALFNGCLLGLSHYFIDGASG